MLSWLKKNRFKHMELDLFMYSMLAVAAAFVAYTLFLVFGFKQASLDGDRARLLQDSLDQGGPAAN